MGRMIPLPDIPEDADPTQKAAIVAESVLQDLPDELRLVAQRCIMLHWFDHRILGAFLPERSKAEPGQIYAQFSYLPFVEPVVSGLAYHELTRHNH